MDDDSTIIRTDLYHKNVRKNFPFLFYEYDAIIAIMASGILIRSIASLIESKVTDPAILNIDDNNNFVWDEFEFEVYGGWAAEFNEVD